MQLRLDALEAHLAKGLAGLYVVYGDEHLLAQEACDRIRVTARAAGFTDRSVFTVERGFDWSSLLGASQSMSLFGDRQLVELRIPSGKPGKEGADALKTLAAAVNDDVLTIVTLPRLDAVSGSRRRVSGWPPVRKGGARWRSSPNAWKAICSPRIRKFRSSGCCIRPAR
jgi:DNA polymerase-3 subunit delta